MLSFSIFARIIRHILSYSLWINSQSHCISGQAHVKGFFLAYYLLNGLLNAQVYAVTSRIAWCLLLTKNI